MRLYLFVINGKPLVRTKLHRAQAALEDHLRGRRDVSDVWWDDENPYQARIYLYGCSHSDFGRDPEDPYADMNFETTDQLIFPTDLNWTPSAPTEQGPPGTLMSLSITSRDGKWEFDRVVPDDVWSGGVIGKNLLLSQFAMDATYGLGDRLLSSKEGS